MRQNTPPFTINKVQKGLVSFHKADKLFEIKDGISTNDAEQSKFAKPVLCTSVIELELNTGIPEKLFGECHLSHDDQLRVVSGNMLVLVLFKKQIHYIPLNWESENYLTIPRLTWHTTMNIGEKPVIYHNWMLGYREQTKTDYQSAYIKHIVDHALVKSAFETMTVQTTDL